MASLKLPFTPITKSNGFLVTANKACVDIITKTMKGAVIIFYSL